MRRVRERERKPLPFDPIAEAWRQWEAHGWAGSAPTMAVVTSVMRVQQMLLRRADSALRGLGLTFARYEVLMLLSFSRRGALPLGKIGERLQVNPASVTNAVGRLEKQGLVERVPNPADGRGTLAALTREGRRLSAEATDVVNAEVFGELGLDPGELHALWALLRRVRLAGGDFNGDGGDFSGAGGDLSGAGATDR